MLNADEAGVGTKMAVEGVDQPRRGSAGALEQHTQALGGTPLYLLGTAWATRKRLHG